MVSFLQDLVICAQTSAYVAPAESQPAEWAAERLREIRTIKKSAARDVTAASRRENDLGGSSSGGLTHLGCLIATRQKAIEIGDGLA